MKWIGEHIWDFVSRFRNDVYLEDLTEVEQEFTIQVAADGKLTKSTAPSERSRIQVRNDEGSVIPAGAPLYSKGEIGGSNRIKVGICVSSDPAKMPCIGIAEFEMNTGDTKDSFAITQGVYNTNISGFTGLTEGDILYVNGGVAPHLTPTKPTNGDLIQNVGIVLKTNGTICQGLLVSAIGRTNDVPWPLYVDHTNQRVGIGTDSPGYKLDVAGAAQIQAATSAYLTFEQSSNQYQAAINSSNHLVLQAAFNNQVIFKDGGATNMVIDGTTSNVGIGTTSPTSKLHVIGDTRIEGDLTVNGTYTQIDTDVNTTEQWLVTNDGTGPAAVINQLGSQDIFDVQDDGTSVFYIEDGGNVGIGTTTPNEKLEVDGNIRLANSGKLYLWQSHDANYLQYYRWELNSSLTAYINNSGSGGVALKTAGNTRLHIDNSGNVGIGTTSPTAKLHITDNSETFRYTSDLGDNFRGIELAGVNPTLKLDGSANTFNISALGLGLAIWDKTSGAYRFSILNNGNVGIGTTSPTSKLQVNGNVAVSNLTSSGYLKLGADDQIISDGSITIDIDYNNNQTDRVFSVRKDNTTELFRVQENGRVGIGTTSPTDTLTINASTASGIVLNNASGSLVAKLYHGGTTGNEFGRFYLKSLTTSSEVYLAASGNSYINSGNVGIGTASPSYKLDVNGTSRVAGTIHMYGSVRNYSGDFSLHNAHQDSDILFKVNGGGTTTTAMMIDGATSNVGIGTASPDGELHVSNTSDFLTDLNGSDSAVVFKESGGNPWRIGNKSADDSFNITQDASSLSTNVRFTIADGGNVGIGTSSPSSKLHVDGGGTFTGNLYINDSIPKLIFTDTDTSTTAQISANSSHLTYTTAATSRDHIFKADTSNLMIIEGTGNVGIGATSPARKLSIQGDGNTALSVTSPNTSYVQLALGDTDDDNYGQIILDNSSNKLQIQNGGGSVISDRGITLDSSENVGIGTASPSEKLHVNGGVLIESTNPALFFTDTNSDSDYSIKVNGGVLNVRDETNDAARISLKSNGNVGIGTASPAAGLQVSKGGTTIPTAGSNTAAAVFGNTTSDDNYGVAIGANSSGVGYISSQRTDGIATTYNLAIQPNGGNVGIGTTSPSQKLHISNGGIRVEKYATGLGGFISVGNATETAGNYSAYYFGNTHIDTGYFKGGIAYETLSTTHGRGDMHFLQRSDTGSGNANISHSVMTILNSGNVGIGTTSPSEKLEVDGNIKLSGNLDIGGSVQKQIQVFPMNFVDDLGTDKHFMPFVTNTEQTVVYQEEAAMVMPADGRVVSVTVHYAQMDGTDGNITVGIETLACGQSYANSWTVEETETIAASVADDHHVFHFAFDNAKHFESTDKMAISIQQSTDMQSAARFFWVTAVVEYDWSTFLGGTSAEYTTTP